MLERLRVKSSNVAEVGYDEESRILEVKFHSGGVYRYKNVPKHLFDSLLSSSSVGKFLHACIYPNYPAENMTLTLPKLLPDRKEVNPTMTIQPRMPVVGETVIYHDPHNKPHNALVTAVWGVTCINLLYVSDNPAETDQYGRQLKRVSSNSHKSLNTAPGNYWRWPEEEANPATTPVGV